MMTEERASTDCFSLVMTILRVVNDSDSNPDHYDENCDRGFH